MSAVILLVLLYLGAVMHDGDYLNDWLTWVDHETAARLEVIGRQLAQLIGGF